MKSREELIRTIQENKKLNGIYSEWKEEQRAEFLDFCTGVRGVKLLYDSFFKEIMNPEYEPERMNEFLSLLLGQEVTVLAVLPNDTTRIADESSLLVTDLVVSLEDGSLANLEVQKIGYLFPGERSACYSSDLLLRQYKRIRGMRKKKFSYKDIKNVYTIVLFENSPKIFNQFPQKYFHMFEQKSDTGLELNLLQKYIFIPLDIFKRVRQNEGIKGKLEAWLTFLSSDEPEDIVRLITDYPEFKVIYDEVYNLCLNVEKVMEMFSKELKELDQNTVQLMIDEMQEDLDAKDVEIESQKKEIEFKDEELASKDAEIESQKKEIEFKDEKLASKDVEIETQKKELASKNVEIDTQRKELKSQADRIKELEEKLKAFTK